VRLPTAYEGPAAAPAGAIALDTWWTAYNDPELTALIEQALARNTDVRTARARLDEVRAQGIESVAAVRSAGDATYSSRRTHTEQLGGTAVSIPGFSNKGTAISQSANFNVSWELDPYGRVFFGAKVATAEVAQARYAYENARASIAAQTADAWFQAKGLAIQLGDSRETARIDTELYSVTDKRAKLGVAATSDADRVAANWPRPTPMWRRWRRSCRSRSGRS